MADSDNNNILVPFWLLEKCQQLTRNQSALEELDLTGNHDIGNNLAVTVSLFLRDNTTLEHLLLSDCGIHDEGSIAIFEMIASNKSIRTLDIGLNYCTVSSMIVLSRTLSCNRTLVELNLENNELEDDGTQELVRGLLNNRTLKILNIGTNHLGTVGVAAVCELLKQSQSLREVLLHENLLGDESAGLIIKAIASNKGSALEILSLGRNEIQPEGAKIIGEMLALTELKELYLHDNSIGAEGVRLFCKGIVDCQKVCALKLLHLQKNGIGNDGAQALGKMLKSTNQRIAELHLQNNEIGPDGAKELARTLQPPDLCSDELGEEGTMATDAALQQLQSLGGNVNSVDDAIQENESSSLEYLDLGENHIGNAGAVFFEAALAKTKRLRKLFLYQNGIGPNGSAAIARGLARNKGSLRTISLADNHIGPLAAEAFGLSFHSSNVNLKELNLEDNGIGERGAELMANGLATCDKCSLEILDIDSNGIGNSGAAAFGRVLSSRATEELHTLFVNSNNMNEIGIAELLESGQSDKGTLCLNLSGNRIRGEFNRIVEIFKTKLRVKTLNLESCFESEEAKASLIQQGLQHNYFIENLHLDEIQDKAVEKEMDLYLRLNKVGRRLLKMNAHAAVWAILLSKVSADHDMLYYFLREKPDLCSYSGHETISRTPWKRRRC